MQERQWLIQSLDCKSAVRAAKSFGRKIHFSGHSHRVRLMDCKPGARLVSWIINKAANRLNER